MKEIQQNETGKLYAVSYLDDGKFKLRTFSSKQRTSEEIAADELDINQELGIDNHTMPINHFPDPFINCCFISDDLIFVNLFHNASLTHHHFFFTLSTRTLSGHTKIPIACNKRNFPQKCFYNKDNEEVYTFYRLG